MAEEKQRSASINHVLPPASDEWKPRRYAGKKKYGLIVYHQRSGWYLRFFGDWEYTHWYETDRDRNNAITKYNRMVTDGISPVIAMAKIER